MMSKTGASSGDLSVEARMILANSEELDVATQLLLSEDDFWVVRSCLAGNRRICLQARQLLAQDPDAGVRTYLRENPAVVLDTTLPRAFLLESPVELFEMMAQERETVDILAREAGVDPEALSALRSGWTGTLGELIETALTFAPNER